MNSNPTEAGDLRLAKHQIAVEAVNRANREPLPGPLGEAFKPSVAIQVGGFSVRPVVASDYVTLRELNSPLYRQMLEGSNESVEAKPEEIFELCFQFTRPAKEVRKVLSKGKEHFREEATSTFGDLPFGDPTIKLVFEAVIEQFKSAMSTMLSHASKEEGKEGVTFFRDSAVNQKTASAGGSTTSAVS